MEYKFEDISSMADLIESMSIDQKSKAGLASGDNRLKLQSQSYAYSQAAFIIRNSTFSDDAG